MKLKFHKYSATGNNFIILDNRNEGLEIENGKLWERLCSVKYGVGADGVLFLRNSESADFKMTYLNADGNEASMCANGLCSLTHFFLNILGEKLIQKKAETKNCIYDLLFHDDKTFIKMNDIKDAGKIDVSDLYSNALESFYVDTGVPHACFEVSGLESLDLKEISPRIRFDKRFSNGTNVNFYTKLDSSSLSIRSYERGVEDETDSCGTGVVACSLACKNLDENIVVKTLGGEVHLRKEVKIVIMPETLSLFLKAK